MAQGADWARLPAASGLVERAREGLVSGGMAITSDGTPVLMGAVPVRLPEGRFGAVLIGEVLDEQLLAQLSAPLEPRRGRRGDGLGAAPGHRTGAGASPTARRSPVALPTPAS